MFSYKFGHRCPQTLCAFRSLWDYRSKVRRFVKINYGPWDRLDGNAPFVDGVGAKPLGANYYPADMTKAEFEAADLSGKDSLYTFLRRDKSGKLKVVPYREQFKQPMQHAAKLLREAADLAEDTGLRRYLLLRAVQFPCSDK